jgi:hypothetical protein
MANVSYWFGSWVSSQGNDLVPGDSHEWIMWGFNYGDAMSVSAHPVVLLNALVERTLSVEDVRVESDLSGNRLYFTIRNTGSNSVPGYGMGFSMISN